MSNFNQILNDLRAEDARVKKAQKWAGKAQLFAERFDQFQEIRRRAADPELAKAWQRAMELKGYEWEVAQKIKKARTKARQMQYKLGLLNRALVLKARKNWILMGESEILDEFKDKIKALRGDIVNGKATLAEVEKFKYLGEKYAEAKAKIEEDIDKLKVELDQAENGLREELAIYKEWAAEELFPIRKEEKEIAEELHKFFPRTVTYRKDRKAYRLKSIRSIEREKEVFLSHLR